MLWPMRKLFGALVAFGFLATAAPAFACPYEDKKEAPAAENKVAKKDAPAAKKSKKSMKKAQARKAAKKIRAKPVAKVAATK